MRTNKKNLWALALLLAWGATFPLRSLACPFAKLITGIIQTGDYEERRGLMAYSKAFGREFKVLLRTLPASDDPHWIDSGAGFGYAQKELIAQPGPGSPIRVTAISAREVRELRKSPKFGTDQVKVFDDGTFIEKIPNATIGRADLITDLYGPISYSLEPDLVLIKYLDLLRPGGSIFIVTSAGTTVKTAGGTVLLEAWIQSLSGLTVTQSAYGIRIRRDYDQPLKIPKLKVLEIKDSLPPLRSFEVVPDPN